MACDITIIHTTRTERAYVESNTSKGKAWMNDSWGQSTMTLSLDQSDVQDLKRKMEDDGLIVDLA